MSIFGQPIAEDALALDAGLELALSPSARIAVNYSGQIASQATDQGVQGNFRLQF